MIIGYLRSGGDLELTDRQSRRGAERGTAAGAPGAPLPACRVGCDQFFEENKVPPNSLHSCPQPRLLSLTDYVVPVLTSQGKEEGIVYVALGRPVTKSPG